MVYALNQVSVDYDGRMALRDVSCSLQEGKWISIIGQSGAGKSTFAKVLKGLIPDFQGEYRMDNRIVQKDAKGRMKAVPEIGYVFQYPEQQIFETTVFKELAFAPKILGYTTKQIEQAIEQILPQVGLPQEILTSVPFQLSGGQKRRLAIASILLMNPKLLILDEPTAGLDPLSRRNILKYLQKWQQQDDRTIVFVSHHMEEVADYSDEVMVFHAGQLLGHYGTTTLFLDQPEVLEKAGLPLPEPVQFMKLIEELSGVTIQVESCKEQDILMKIRSIWQARGLSDGQ